VTIEAVRRKQRRIREITLPVGRNTKDRGLPIRFAVDKAGAAATADDTEFNIFNTDRKLSALQDAATKLSVFPEKKALVYFSSGIQKTGVENESQIKATVCAKLGSPMVGMAISSWFVR